MENVFAIGDIHGKLHMFKEMLKQWNPDNQQLVLLGDLIDRGEDSYGVVRLAQELSKKYGAKVLTGNHEELFLSWLDTPDSEVELYYPQGGRETIDSFLEPGMTFSHSPQHIANLIKTKHGEEISFLEGLPYYYEWNDFVFVHAGVDLLCSDWKDTRTSDFCWIRRDFHFKSNHTGKTFVFGHTPTRMLNPDKRDDIWLSPCKTKIGLDGGAVFGGELHGLLLTGETATSYSLKNSMELAVRPFPYKF